VRVSVCVCVCACRQVCLCTCECVYVHVHTVSVYNWDWNNLPGAVSPPRIHSWLFWLFWPKLELHTFQFTGLVFFKAVS
jgi:hypothetical protein